MIRLTRDEVWDIYASLEDREEISDEILNFFFEIHKNMEFDGKVEIFEIVLDS